MRLFQFHSFYRDYLRDFNGRYPETVRGGFRHRLACLLSDRFYSLHILKPVFEGREDTFFTVANDTALQHQWAAENGLAGRSAQEILLAQIEAHRADVLYALDPITFGSEFVRKLPGCVKVKICWNGVPAPHADLSAYDSRLCNFPFLLMPWKEKGWRCDLFHPSVDPLMHAFSPDDHRGIDVSFVGQYTPDHTTRNRLLESMMGLGRTHVVSVRLSHPKWKPLIPLRGFGRIPSFVPYLPSKLRGSVGPALFGIGLYQHFYSSKVVLNAAIDGAGRNRGNMRCFEALGSGAAMLSDEGDYPEGMVPERDFMTYRDADDAIAKMKLLLADDAQRLKIASNGHKAVTTMYSKERQWQAFEKIVAHSHP